MPSVFIVEFSDYDDHGNIAVFSNREDAELVAKDRGGKFHVEQYEVFTSVVAFSRFNEITTHRAGTR